jgi:hypothetical protein
MGTAAFSCSEKVFVAPPALAVSVASCAAVTEETVAVNPALAAFAGTATEPGTVTAGLLLDRLIVSPPFGAAEAKVNVQTSVPDPVIDPLLQESPLSAAGAAVPNPLRPIAAVAPLEELLAIVN